MLRLIGLFFGVELMPVAIARNLFSEPRYDVRVRLSRDGFLVFKTDAGSEIYDIAARDFRNNTAHWLHHLQAKNWFTVELETSCLELAGVYPLNPFA